MMSLAQNRTAVLVGEVHDVTGALVPGTVAELKLETSPGSAFKTEADELGVYRFDNLPQGDYTLKLRRPGFRSLTVKSIRVSEGAQKLLPPFELAVSVGCGAGEGPALDYIRLTESGNSSGNLGGSVRLDEGPMKDDTPRVVDADVTLMCGGSTPCGKTKSDSTGEFLFKDLARGPHTIRVSKEGYYPFQDSDYEVQSRRERVYGPIRLQRCPKGDCDPKRRPKWPLSICE